MSGFGIAADAADNIYIVGRKDLSLFMEKYQAGTNLWNQTWAEAYFSRGWDIVTDNEYLYTVGDLLPSGIGDKPGLLLIKWDTTGNLIWNRTWINSHAYTGRGVAVDEEGSIYTVGMNGSQAILIKWNSSGTRLWNRTWSSSYCSEVAVDGNGDIITAGLFLIKWNQAGLQLWNKTLGFSTGLEVDAEDFLYTIGLFLWKWDMNGNQLWNQTWTSHLGRDVALSNDGGVYTISSDPPEYNTKGVVVISGSEWVLTRWDTSGNYIDSITTEYAKGTAWGMVVDSAGYVHCIGELWLVTESRLIYEIFSPLTKSISGFGFSLIVLTCCLLVFSLKKIKSHQSRNKDSS
ncbi:MAG: hypothetical protein ACFFC7_34260 [Candidatus Hermodarchaeota archaeon]